MNNSVSLPPGALPWDDPGWLDRVQAWIETQLDYLGFQATQPLEILHQRAWTTFIKVSTDRGEDRVPGLANVPILKHLFKNRRRSEENEELLIFITPRVVKL